MNDIIDDFKNVFWTDERVLEYGQIASEYQFRFKKRVRFSTQPYQLKGFQLFQGKKGKRLNGILEKKEKELSLKTRIYDYIYYGSSKKRISTVFEFHSPSMNFSKIFIRPKGMMKRMKSFLGGGTNYFEGTKKFNKNYEILTNNPENLVYELNQDFLNLLGEQKKLSVEAEGNYLLFYFKNKTIPLGELMDEYDYISALFDRLIYRQSNEEYV